MKTNRRILLQGAGAATVAFPMIIPAKVLGASAPSNVITVGSIGLGPQGAGREPDRAAGNTGMFVRNEEARVLAVCDCDLEKARAAQRKVNLGYGNQDCGIYQDFRDLIARKDIDAICISTPDHWHMPMSMMALKAGKHVFCEKPSLFITEGREMVEEANRRGAVFQWGIEDRSLIKYYRLAGWARTGVIGDLEYAECSLPSRGPFKKSAPEAVRPDLDWNLWLGPAPWEEYTAMGTDRDRWRMHNAYSGGSLTDWGTHICDTGQVGLGVDETGPVKVKGTARMLDPEVYDSNVPVNYNIECWYENGTRMMIKNGAASIKFVGSKGWVSCHKWNGEWDASDREILRIKDFDPELYWPRPVREQENFITAIKNGTRKTTYDAEAGHRLSSMLHLGHISIRSGKTVKWDPVKEAFTADADLHTKDIVYQREARDWANA